MPQRTLAAAIFLALAVTLFFVVALGRLDRFLYRPGEAVSDLTVTFWPNIHYIQEMWRTERQIPLWRTLIFSGAPFDADPQSGLWYPPNLIFGFLPAAIGFNLLFIAHGIWAGLGMGWWSRGTGTSVGGSLLAGLAYALTPKLLAHLGFGHVGLVYAAAWVPWGLGAAYHVGRGRRWGVGGLGLALGLQFIAHPQLAFYTGLAAGLYGLATAMMRPPAPPFRRTGRALGHLLLAALLALAVAAIQLLPLLHMAPRSARAGMGFSESAVSSLPPRYLWGLVLAHHRGFMDYVLYVGVPVLALAAVAARRRQARFWWALVLTALVYSLGTHTPLYRWAFRLLPGLTWLRAPSRIWFVAAAALALMAGWGADRLNRGLTRRGQRWLHRVAAALGGLALALPLGYGLAIGPPPANLIALGLVGPGTAIACIGAASRRLPRWAGNGALITVLLLDLTIVDGTMITGKPAETVFGQETLASYLAERMSPSDPFRTYSPSYSLPRHVAARYGIETADGVDPLYLAAYDAWMEVASGVERTGYTETVPSLEDGGKIATANRDARPDPRLLGLLNVRYVAAEFPLAVAGLEPIGRFGSTYLYQNVHALPRVFVVGKVEPVESFEEALEWIQSGDVAHVAAVEEGPPLTSGEIEAEIVWTRRSPNRLALDVTLDRRGFLVLSQVWYTSWSAEVDGEPVPLWKADGTLSGVYLEAGKHKVSFTYRPRWTLISGWVSGMTWIALGSTAAWWMWKRKRGARDGHKL